MTARERVDYLLDEKSDRIEIDLLRAMKCIMNMAVVLLEELL